MTLQQAIHPLPGDFAAAMTTAKPFPPEPDHSAAESGQRLRVARDPVVREVPAKLLTQRHVLLRYRVVSIPPAPVRDPRQSPAEAAPGRLALHHPVRGHTSE